MSVRPVFGNLIIETRPRVVAFRLNTDSKTHEALFTYREIAKLAEILAGLNEPDEDPDDPYGGVI